MSSNNISTLHWNVVPSKYLDYLRMYELQFMEAEDASGTPLTADEHAEIYAWENVEHDGNDFTTQKRKYFALDPEDLFMGEFSVDRTSLSKYPEQAVNPHTLYRENKIQQINAPHVRIYVYTSNQSNSSPNHSFEFITKSGTIFEFTDARMVDETRILFERDHNKNITKTYQPREFPTYTLLKMYKNVPSFELPEEISMKLVASNI